jgi:hypothetical protein
MILISARQGGSLPSPAAGMGGGGEWTYHMQKGMFNP